MCKSLLYVEDSKLQQHLFKCLYKNEYDIKCVDTAEDAIAELSANNGSYDGVVTDLHIGAGMNGDELAKWVRKHHPNKDITILTANVFYSSPNIRVLYKPFEKKNAKF